MKRRARAVRIRRKSKRPRKYGRTMSRRLRGLRRPTLFVKRTFWYEYFSFSTASTNGYWRYYQPSLSVLPNLAEYQALFDQYKINRVKITLRPRWDNFDGANLTTAGTSNAPLQTVHYYVDPQTTTAPSGIYNSATLNSFLENGDRVRTVPGTRPINIYYKPMMYEDANNVTFAKLTGPKWLDLQNATTVTQRGVHVFLQNTNFGSTSGYAYDVFFTFYLAFKGSK